MQITIEIELIRSCRDSLPPGECRDRLSAILREAVAPPLGDTLRAVAGMIQRSPETAIELLREAAEARGLLLAPPNPDKPTVICTVGPRKNRGMLTVWATGSAVVGGTHPLARFMLQRLAADAGFAVDAPIKVPPTVAGFVGHCAKMAGLEVFATEPGSVMISNATGEVRCRTHAAELSEALGCVRSSTM